jgi:hypothetical protein
MIAVTKGFSQFPSSEADLASAVITLFGESLCPPHSGCLSDFASAPSAACQVGCVRQKVHEQPDHWLNQYQESRG